MLRCTRCQADVAPPLWLQLIVYAVLCYMIVYGILGARTIRDGEIQRAQWTQYNHVMQQRLEGRWVYVPPGDTAVVIRRRRPGR